MVAAVARIVAAVRVPVTADIEGGYGDVAGTVRAVIQAGAVGINLEDSRISLLPAGEQAERIAAARAAAEAEGSTCSSTPAHRRLPGGCSGDQAAEVEGGRGSTPSPEGGQAVRARPARPGRHRSSGQGAAAAERDGRPGAPPVAELAAAGVAGVSVGSAIAQSAYAVAAQAAAELLAGGTYETLADGLAYGALNDALR